MVSVGSYLLWSVVAIISLGIAALNAFVLTIFVCARMLNTRQNVVVLHLVISDLFRGIVYFAETVAILSNPAIGESHASCTAIGFFYVWATVESCIGVGLIIYDRLLFLSGPVNYVHRMTWKLLILIVVYSAFHSLMAAILPITGWSDYSYQPHWVTCDINWNGGNGYGVFLIIWGFIVPAILTVICFIRISGIVQRRMATVQIYGANQTTLVPMGVRQSVSEGGITEVDAAYMKTAKILTAMFIFFIISWTFYVVFAIVLMALPPEKVPGEVVPFMRLITMATSVANPCLYGVYNRKFRQTAKSIITLGQVVKEDVEDIRPPEQLTGPMASMNNHQAVPSSPEAPGTSGEPSFSRSGLKTTATQPKTTKFRGFAKSVWT